MAKIKVVGYMDTDDIAPDLVDVNDETGLSENGFLYFGGEFDLDDLQFTLEKS